MMVRSVFLTLGVVGLAACGGTTTTYAPNVYPAVTGQGLVTQGPFAVQRTAQVTSAGAVNHATVSLKFVSATAVDVTISGGQPVRLTSSGGAFTDPTSGSPMTLLFSQTDLGGAASSQMLTFVLKDATGVNVQDAFVAGNRTLARDMPKSAANATYNGVAKVYDGSSTTLPDGQLALVVNFANNNIQGNLTGISVNGVLADFQLTPTTMGVGSKAGTYTINAMNATGVTLNTTGVTNAVEGAFFGPGAKETGGVFRIYTTTGNVAGTFAGVTP